MCEPTRGELAEAGTEAWSRIEDALDRFGEGDLEEADLLVRLRAAQSCLLVHCRALPAFTREVPGNSGGVEEALVEGETYKVKHVRTTEGKLVKVHRMEDGTPTLYDFELPSGQVRRIPAHALLPPFAPTPPQLSNEDRERLTDIADHIEAGLELTDEDAAFLRKLASQSRGDLFCSHCGRLDGRPHNVDCPFAKEERQQRADAVPVVRAEPGKDRIDFELECGHVVGLARADVVSVNGRDELELPSALVCPVCQEGRDA